jgi:hypothetical protein
LTARYAIDLRAEARLDTNWPKGKGIMTQRSNITETDKFIFHILTQHVQAVRGLKVEPSTQFSNGSSRDAPEAAPPFAPVASPARGIVHQAGRMEKGVQRREVQDGGRRKD